MSNETRTGFNIRHSFTFIIRNLEYILLSQMFVVRFLLSLLLLFLIFFSIPVGFKVFVCCFCFMNISFAITLVVRLFPPNVALTVLAFLVIFFRRAPLVSRALSVSYFLVTKCWNDICLFSHFSIMPHGSWHSFICQKLFLALCAFEFEFKFEFEFEYCIFVMWS